MNGDKNILIAGMGQSGSTLLFNLIRLLFEKQIYKKQCEIVTFDNVKLATSFVSKNGCLTINLLKIHGYSDKAKEWADCIITARRDLRDAAASSCRKGKHRDYMRACINNVKYYEDWKEESDYEFVYTNYKNNPQSIVKEIMNIMSIKLSDEKINEVIADVEKLPFLETLPKNDNDNINPFLWRKTFLSKSHNTSNGKIGSYKDFFSEKEIEEIEEKFGDWLLANGYKLDFERK